MKSLESQLDKEFLFRRLMAIAKLCFYWHWIVYLGSGSMIGVTGTLQIEKYWSIGTV